MKATNLTMTETGEPLPWWPDLGCHDETAGGGVDGDVPRHQSNVLKLLVQLTILLVTEGLDWGRVDHSLFVTQWHGNSIPTNQVQQRVSMLVSLSVTLQIKFILKCLYCYRCQSHYKSSSFYSVYTGITVSDMTNQVHPIVSILVSLSVTLQIKFTL